MRNKLIKSDAENRAKDEYIKAMEQKINMLQNESGITKNLDAKG